MSVFETVGLPFVLHWEAGRVDDPQDPGGRTAYGITQRTYDRWRTAHGLAYEVGQDVWRIELATVRTIYYTDYWSAIAADQLPDPVALVLFDAAVNQGADYARKLLQWGVGVVQDGVIGPRTLGAVANYPAAWLAEDLVWARMNRYRALVRQWRAQGKPNPDRFLDGWLNRLDACRDLLPAYRRAA